MRLKAVKLVYLFGNFLENLEGFQKFPGKAERLPENLESFQKVSWKVWKVSRKVSGKSGRLPESFWKVWKVSRKFPESLKGFRKVWKLLESLEGMGKVCKAFEKSGRLPESLKGSWKVSGKSGSLP